MTKVLQHQINEAKKLLRDNGYVVQNEPIAWKEYKCVVSLTMKAPNFSNYLFAEAIQRILNDRLYNAEQIRAIVSNDALAVGLLSVKGITEK